MKRSLLFSLFIVISFSSLLGQSAEQFREAANAALKAFDVPGFSVGIIKDGEIVLAEGFGTRTYGKEEPVDEHTLFAIASNTKAFVATALAKLEVEEKLSLNDPVRQHLPYFEVYDEYVSNHMLVKDLLCHRSGFGSFSGDVIWYKSTQTAEEVLKRIKHLPQTYEWRSGYGYSNLMVITGGEVIKSVTNQSWGKYIDEQFFTPLGMDRTLTSVKGLAAMDNIATPHITKNNNQAIPYVNWDNMGAAGGIISSSSDMLKWIQLQIDEGMYQEKEIFPAAVLNQTWKPYNALGSSKTFISSGLGWFLSHLDGHRIVNHGGGYDGMYSQVKIAPDDQLGVVVLTNSMTGLSSTLANYIINSYLGRDTENWLEYAIERQAASKKKWDDRRRSHKDSRELNTSPTVPKEAYLGTYTDPMFGDIEIVMEEENLALHFNTSPELNAKLSHWHFDTWKIEWNEPHAWFDFGTVQFVLDNQRKITRLLFDVPNDDIFFHEIEAVRE